MRPPPLPIRGSRESAALLDRGGRPTLRELLSGLEFDAGSGALRLNQERVTLQPAEADRILRRELIQMLGEEEARIFLLRRGFRMGLHDAAFIARSWPTLDRGDAFTAGPRVHQFSGIVRVETIHNDFDFARGRFSAEFLWHNSLEAEDGRDGQRVSERPVCWQQLGYASGYASHFFGSLVVYKETACVAQGHRACRVVGRLAAGWGEDDPDVMLFRNRVAPHTPEVRKPRAVEPASAAGAEAVLLAPVKAALMRAARLPLPCLIAGPGSCGQEIAALFLSRQVARSEVSQRLICASMRPDDLASATAILRRPRRKEAGVVVLEGIEALSADLQQELGQDLAGDAPLRGTLIATSGRSLDDLSFGGLVGSLWLQLAPAAIEMPGLATRAEHLPALAALRLAELAARLDAEVPEIAPGAFDVLADQPPPAGLAGLDALLKTLLVQGAGQGPIDAAGVLAWQRRLGTAGRHAARPLLADAPQSQASEADWIDAMLASGEFSLPAHEARLRAIAIQRAGGNMAAAARALGISRPQLAYRERIEKG